MFSLDISAFDLVVNSCGDTLGRGSGEAGHKALFFYYKTAAFAAVRDI
jgi:hypothetical protein